MNIAFFIGSLSDGGAEWQCLLNANALAKKGYQVTICTLSSDITYLSKLNSLAPGLKILPLSDLRFSSKFVKTLKLLKAALRLRSFVKKANVNVVYAWLELPQFISFFSVIFTKTKLIWAIRNAGISEDKSYWKMNLLIRINKYFCFRVNGVVSNSQRGIDRYVRDSGYQIKNEAIIYNTVDTFFFNFPAIREKTPGLNVFSLLIVGRLTPIKNLAELFSALVFLKEQSDKLFKLFIVGNGDSEYENQLRWLAKKLNIDDRMVWVGKVENPVSFYQRADLFILPSLDEGLSNSLLEAMACKTLCLSTDVGDSVEFLSQDLIIKNKDAKTIAEKIIWASNLSNDQINEYTEDCHARIKEKCSEGRVVRQLEGFLSKI